MAGDRARAPEAARRAAERAAARARRTRAAPVVLASLEREARSGASLLAGGLAYRLFFWLVAFGLVLAAAASFWVRSSRESLVDAARGFGLSGVAARSAAEAVSSGSHTRWYLLATGIVLLVTSGVGAVRALRVAALIAWGLEPSRLRHVLRASAAFTALLVVGLGATALASWVRAHGVGLGVAATAGTVAVVVALAWTGLVLLPRRAETGSWSVLPGALLTGAGFAAIHVFGVYYLAGRLERSPQLYGTLGAAAAVLVGLFLVARVLVSAMFLNATLDRLARGGSPDRDEETAAPPEDPRTAPWPTRPASESPSSSPRSGSTPARR